MVDKKQKGKKRWFTILAPQIFNSKEIAEITAYAPEDLKGRFVEVTGHMLTGIPRDSSRKYKLKVSTITGEKVATTAHRYYIAESFVQRSVRRYKERFAFVLNAQTKDEKAVKLKLFLLKVKKLHHSTRGELLRATKAFVESALKEYDSEKIFDPLAIDTLANDLKKQLVEIAPVDKMMVLKLELK